MSQLLLLYNQWTTYVGKNLGILRMAFICLFFLSPKIALAQNRGVVKGKLVDSVSESPLVRATVAIVNSKDSSLVAFTLTDKEGQFSLHNIPIKMPLRILISFVSYPKFKKEFTVENSALIDLGKILFNKRTLTLNEVKIIGDSPPVTVTKDTIEFLAEAFKVRPNAVVEELLNKLPGLQVNSDGTILVNGKSISKILINGHEYFTNDPRIATRNLDAEMIDKIQIYDDRDNDPDKLVDESKVQKIINLKFRKQYKKSFFGKVYAGTGPSQRYESGLLLNSLRDTLQVSLIGYSNNLSHTAFSRDDLSSLGGFDRSGSDQLNNGNIPLGSKISDGIEQTKAIGLNINDDYGKKLKINFLLFFNNIQDTYKRSSLNETFLDSTTLFQNQLNDKQQKQNSYTLSSLIQWHPSDNLQIRYTPHFFTNDLITNNNLFTNQYNNYNQHLNTEIDTLFTKTRPTTFDHTFNLYKKVGDNGTSLNFTNKLLISSNSANNYLNDKLINYQNKTVNDTTRQLNSTLTKSWSMYNEVVYRIPFTEKLIGLLSYNNAIIEDKNQNVALNYDNQLNIYSVILPTESADVSRNILVQSLKPGLTYNITSQISINLGLTAQWQYVRDYFYVNKPVLKEQYFYLLPSYSLQGGKFTLNYSQNIIQPNIGDLNPAEVKVNSYLLMIGNPYLSPTRTQNLSLNFYNYDTEKQISLLLNASGTLNSDPVYYRSYFDNLGIQTTTPQNGFHSSYLFVGGNLTKRFKEFNGWTATMRGNLYQGIRNSVVAVDNESGSLHYYYWIAASEVLLQYKSIFEITPRIEFDPAVSSYKNISYPDVTNFNNKVLIKYVLRFSNSISIDGDYTRFFDSQLSSQFQRVTNLLNSSFIFQFSREKTSQIKISAYDILNQNISIFRTVSANTVYQGENLIQKRYILFTYQYKFNTKVHSTH